MAEKLPVFASSMDHSYAIRLDSTTFTLRFVWRERTQSWYLDVFDSDAAPVVLGRRLSPSSPLWDYFIEGVPVGLFWTTGVDGYTQLDAGVSLELLRLFSGDYPVAADPDAAVFAVQ